MDTKLFIVLLTIGLIGGFVSGMSGIGGAIIMIPLLTLLLGFTQHKAQGTTLALLLFPVVALSVYNYYKQGYVDFKLVLFIALGFFVGSYLGSLLAVNLSGFKLKKIFAVVILIISIKMLFFDKS